MNPTKISTRTVNAHVIILGFKYIGKTVNLFYKPTRSYQFIFNHSSIIPFQIIHQIRSERDG